MGQIRIDCCIIGCRKSCANKRGFTEWICADHWRTIPKPTRDQHLRLMRYIRKDPAQALLCRVELGRAWEACRKAGTEAAAGLG